MIHSREAPPGPVRPAGRITAEDLAPLIRSDTTAYVCGSVPFTGAVGELLVGLGLPAERIRIERFGPTG